MENQPQIKKEITLLRIIFGALLAGQILFLLVTHFVLVTPEPDMDTVDTFKFVVPVVLLFGVSSGYFVTAKLLNATSKSTDLLRKLIAYKSVCIIRFATIEGGVLFAIVCYLLSSHYLFLIYAIAGLILFVLQYPSVNRTAKDLKLESYERQMLM